MSDAPLVVSVLAMALACLSLGIRIGVWMERRK